MMLYADIETIKIKMDIELAETEAVESIIERLGNTSRIIEAALADLKSLLEKQQFENAQQEINFFKKFKPEIVAVQIAGIIKYNLDLNKLIGTPESEVRYYEEELQALNSFFRLNNYHYQYYKNSLTQLDSLYFLRSSRTLPIPFVELTDNDAEFSTPMSYLFAKFIAYEQVQYYILGQISVLKNPQLGTRANLTPRKDSLRWTGDAVNMVELVYGLYLTGQLNNGNATLTQIVKWLENNLQVHIGNVQHRFSEIGKRKRLSPTRFLDQMKDNILQKLENDNG